jgi:PilZ domain
MDRAMPTSTGSERRRSKRGKYRANVRFSAAGRAGAGFASGMSRRGLFVQSETIPPDGVEIDLVIRDPARGELHCAGRVVRLKTTLGSRAAASPGGFGVELASASESYYELIAALTSK